MPTPNLQGPAFAPISVQLRGSFFSPITPVSNFSSIVRAQKSHYLAVPGMSYSLPSTIVQKGRLGIANLSVINNLIQTNALESETTNFTNILTDHWSSLQTDIVRNLQKLQQDYNVQEFIATTTAMAEQSKESYGQAVDGLVNQISTLGTDHPEIQNSAIVVLNDVFGVISSAAERIYQFFDNIFVQVQQVVEAIAEWVRNAITTIGNTVGDAVSSVVSAIGDLF